MSDPTPDPELTELASAYLDGAADQAEVARVEADPDLLAEVERLRVVRALVSTSTEEATLSVREAHLAAALDVFDRMSPAERAGEMSPAAGVDDAAAAAITTPTPIGSRRSAGGPTPIGQWLLGAAAALLLVVGGVAVFRAGQSDDDADADLAFDAAPAETEAAGADPFGENALPPNIDGDDAADGDDRELLEADVAAAESGDAAIAEVAADEALAESDDAMDEEEPAEEEAFDEEEALEDEESSDDGGDEAEADGPGVQPSPGPEDGDSVLADDVDLADFAAQAVYADIPEGGPAVTSPSTVIEVDDDGVPTVLRCIDDFPFDVVAGPALLDLAGLDDPTIPVGADDDAIIEVLVGVTDLESIDGETTGRVIAADIVCDIVADTDLPSEADFDARSLLEPNG